METWRMKILPLLLILCTSDASFVDTYNWVSIDCGAASPTLDLKNMINWETDADYTKSGINKNVSGDHIIAGPMKTLRCFPDGGDTNCYSFSVDAITKYLVRARFYYGNYDGLSNPPAFDVFVSGLRWTTVVTSLSEDPVVIEGTFRPGTDILSVCLAGAKGGGGGGRGIPFISSLEVTPWPFNTYKVMDLYSAFLLQSRITFGGEEDVGYNGNFSSDKLNRIWKAEGLPDYRNVSAASSFIVGYTPNLPPDSALMNAIEAPGPSDSIVIPANLTKTQQSLCVMLYFVELSGSRGPNDTRRFQVDIGGQKNLSTVDLQIGEPQLATLSLQMVDGPTNITISPTGGSTLPPIVNAMEVYTTMAMERPSSPTSRVENVRSNAFILILMCLLCAVVV